MNTHPPGNAGPTRRRVLRCVAVAAVLALVTTAGPALAAGQPGVTTGTAEQRCATAAAAIKLPDGPPVTITSTSISAARDGSWAHVPVGSGKVPQHCVIDGKFASGAGFLVKLPVAGWNTNFFMQGCGGDCGRELLGSYAPLIDYGLSKGYAVAWTDLRPAATSTVEFGNWSYNNREVEYDFFPRATHNTAVLAKQAIATFYNRKQQYSYFHGNSTGGRNALIEVQRYPHDFDGVLAGAPGIVKGGIPGLWNGLANLDEQGRNIMTSAKMQMLAAAAMKSCDGVDKLKDGVIENPDACKFKPQDIACPGDGDRADCLTKAEVGVIAKLYQTPSNSQGPLIAGGNPVGSELEWSSYFSSKVGTSPKDDPSVAYRGSTQRLRYLTFENDPGPGYFPEDFDIEDDIPRLSFMEQIRNQPSNPDLREFRAAGGKLILYQGLADQNVTPKPTTDYYEAIERAMGGKEATQKFVRYFAIPGKNHSSFDPGGSGAHTIDWLPYLTNWVEKGKAPGQIVGENAERGFSRTFYPYPTVSRWNGKGNVNDAKNWVAVRER